MGGLVSQQSFIRVCRLVFHDVFHHVFVYMSCVWCSDLAVLTQVNFVLQLFFSPILMVLSLFPCSALCFECLLTVNYLNMTFVCSRACMRACMHA